MSDKPSVSVPKCIYCGSADTHYNYSDEPEKGVDVVCASCGRHFHTKKPEGDASSES